MALTSPGVSCSGGGTAAAQRALEEQLEQTLQESPSDAATICTTMERNDGAVAVQQAAAGGASGADGERAESTDSAMGIKTSRDKWFAKMGSDDDPDDADVRRARQQTQRQKQLCAKMAGEAGVEGSRFALSPPPVCQRFGQAIGRLQGNPEGMPPRCVQLRGS